MIEQERYFVRVVEELRRSNGGRNKMIELATAKQQENGVFAGHMIYEYWKAARKAYESTGEQILFADWLAAYQGEVTQ